ncbi:MAG: hypothetical protein A2V79_09255 [Betaproteobacteria bacterium RBG_16_56_24]|nr:MAG: hypothetical protein A2V79_09255 [Betaproteobacteria bacterium RBG_16_56_24]
MDDLVITSPSTDSLVEKKKPARAKGKLHRLDGADMLKLFSTLLQWFSQEWQRQGANRFQMALDEDYYDSLQWDEEDAQILIDRGQAPVVYNEIKPTIDWMIGTQRRMRVDSKVLARRKEGTKNAEAKTSLLKYLSDTNKAIFHRSRVFDDSLKAGMGVIEVGLRGDPTEELLFERYQDWRCTLYDSNSVELDLTDARYFFRWKDLDEDIALAYFPDRSDVVRASLRNEGSGDEDVYAHQDGRTDPSEDWQPRTGRYQPYDSAPFTSSQRRVVRFTECWYRVPVMRKVFVDGDLRGEKYNKTNPDHVAAANQGYGLFDKLEMEVRVAIYTPSGLVFEGISPYRHGRIPFVVSWCYRRKRDNAPYGVARPLRDAQDGMNKRNSKAHWVLSTNQVIMDKGAVEDIEGLREEVARGDGVIEVSPGKKLEIKRDIDLAETHLQMMDRDAQHIRNAGGVNAENLGRESNATSGIAIQARQEQGSVVNTQPFDNFRYALQQIGEMELSMIEQFYSEEKSIRIVGGTGAATFMELNTVGEDGRYLNDITAEQADFVISEQDYRSTLKQAMFESLFEVLGRMAQMGEGGLKAALNMLDLVIDMVDLPNKDELVKRIREINGQKDPDAEETPEEQKANAEQAAQQQEQMEIARRAELANLALLEGKVAQLGKQVEKLDAERLVKTIEAIYSAIQAGGIVATTPGVAPVADEILLGAGMKSVSGESIDIPDEQGQVAPVQDLQQPEQQTGINQGIQTAAIDGLPQQ